MIDAALYGYFQGKGDKHQVFTASGTFVAPIDARYFISGVAGGASGRVGADSADRPGGGGGESITMFPIYLTAGTSVAVTIAAGGTGDGASGGNTSFGSYLTLIGGGGSSASYNSVGGGKLSITGHEVTTTVDRFTSSDKKPGANARSSNLTTETFANFPSGAKAGTYMWGGAGSKYGAGGAANASGAGSAGGIGAGGGSGTTAAGAGGPGYLEIMWQE